jgi:hypothetical protein
MNRFAISDASGLPPKKRTVGLAPNERFRTVPASFLLGKCDAAHFYKTPQYSRRYQPLPYRGLGRLFDGFTTHAALVLSFLAGVLAFFQTCSVYVDLSLRGNKIANCLTVPRYGNRLARRSVLS